MRNEIIGFILYNDNNLGVKIPWPETCRATQTESKVNIVLMVELEIYIREHQNVKMSCVSH